MDCLFCQIVNKEKPAEFIYEDQDAVAIKDINPKAPVHLLIIPKKHLESIKEMEESDEKLIGHLAFVAKKIASQKNLAGFQLIFNVGRQGGQIIDHIHLHLLSG